MDVSGAQEKLAIRRSLRKIWAALHRIKHKNVSEMIDAELLRSVDQGQVRVPKLLVMAG